MKVNHIAKILNESGEQIKALVDDRMELIARDLKILVTNEEEKGADTQRLILARILRCYANIRSVAHIVKKEYPQHEELLNKLEDFEAWHDKANLRYQALEIQYPRLHEIGDCPFEAIKELLTLENEKIALLEHLTTFIKYKYGRVQ